MTDLNIRGAEFRENETDGYGAAISAGEGKVNITNTVFAGNTAGIDGGALDLFDSHTEMSGCVFSGNISQKNGGAFAAHSTALMINDSDLENNSTVRSGSFRIRLIGHIRTILTISQIGL